jgi:subtilisin family serine protease
MTKQWRTVLGAAVLAFATTGAAQADDPFLKTRQGRLSHEMNVRALAAEGERVPGVRAAGAGRTPATGAVTAVVELRSAADAAAVTARVQSLGGHVVKAVDHLLKVQVPVGSLRALGDSAGVTHVRAPFQPSRKEVVSQGVATTHAREYSARTGATGAGVSVVVLDGGFARAVDLVGTELPEDTAATDYVRDRLGSYEGVHGTACAEIVHDMAPDAEIILAGFEDDVTWAAAVDEIVAAGVKIVSHSIGFDNLYPSDGNNYYAQKVDEASAAGVLFVTAAGNEGQKYWSGAWRDANGNGFLEFGGTELLPIGAGAPGSQVVLRWDDAFGGSTHDYDLLIVTQDFLSNPTLSRDNPAIVAASAGLQDGSQDPREIARFEVPSDRVLYAVVVHDPASPLRPDQRFWIWAADGVGAAYQVRAGSLTMPGDARGALTVGAVDFASGSVEAFSSRGPAHDGRVKPDIVAPDRVATAAYDGQPFAGTSAATPHVAGAAALLLSRNPGLGMNELRALLESATSSGGRTKNNDTGAGTLDLNLLR